MEIAGDRGTGKPLLEKKTRRRIQSIGAVILAGFLALTMWTDLTKAPWCDEGWFASPAYNLAFRGFMGTTVLDPASGTPTLHTRTRLDGIDRYTYWVMPLDLVAQAGWYKLVGFSLLRMRILSMIWAVLALACWWIVFNELSGSPYTALLGVALLTVNSHFLTAAADGRMDIMCAALGAAGTASYLFLRLRSLGWALFTANSLIAASALTHPNGVIYFVALACLVWIYDRRRLRWTCLGIAALPYMIGAGAWLVYIMRDPVLFKIQLLGNAAGRTSAFTAPLRALQLEARRYLYGFGFAPWSTGFAHLSVLELLLFLAGIFACATYSPLRKQPAARTVVVIAAGACAFLFLFEGAKIVGYLVHVVPWFCLAAAIALSDYFAARRGPLFLPAAALALVFLLDLSRIALPAMRDKYHRQFLPAAQYLEQTARPPDLIMGSAELAFVLGFDRNILDDIMLGTTTGKSARFIVMEDRYRDYLDSIRLTAPQDYQRVAQHLAGDYEKIYDRASYQVYRRR